jgi:hypothetical protein
MRTQTSIRPSRSLWFSGRDYHYDKLTKRELAQMHQDVASLRKWGHAKGAAALAQIVRMAATLVAKQRPQ